MDASHTGSVAVRHNRHSRATSSYVTPGAVLHLNFSLFAVYCRLSVCQSVTTGQFCPLSQVTFCIHARFVFPCVPYLFSGQCTISDTQSASASTADHPSAYLAIANGSLVTRTAASLAVAKFSLFCFLEIPRQQ